MKGHYNASKATVSNKLSNTNDEFKIMLSSSTEHSRNSEIILYIKFKNE